MGLRPTHLGYAYQDLLTAIRLVDVALGLASTVTVDTKLYDKDRFDDLTTEWLTGKRDRLQIKHSEREKDLAKSTFTADKRDLRLDLLIRAISTDAVDHPGTAYRILLRDDLPQDLELTTVLRPIAPNDDPGPALHRLNSTRLRFDFDALRTTTPWVTKLRDLDDTAVHQMCDSLIVEVGTPAFSLDLLQPGPAEQVLLRRVTEELGAGRPPNEHRDPEIIARALIDAAKAARSTNGTVTAATLIPHLGLVVDFGAVRAGHPIERTSEVRRPILLDSVVAELGEAARAGGSVILTAGPGLGKTWLSQELEERLNSDAWIVARHHCWLRIADADRDQRVLSHVVIGSILQQLNEQAPDSVSTVRPRYAATIKTLSEAIATIRLDQPDRLITLIVDGLDHITRVQGCRDGSAFNTAIDPARLLVEELASLELPPGVVLVVASQPGNHLDPLAGKTTTRYVELAPFSRKDITDLAERLGVLAALGPAPSEYAATQRVETLVQLLFERSQGNALYATYLCRQALGPDPSLTGPVERDEQVFADPIARLCNIPSSAHDLDDYYAYLFAGLTEQQRLAVALLAVCDFAVTADELREIFPQVALTLSAALRAVAPIVTQQPTVGGLKIHHESFSRYIRTRHVDDMWLTPVRDGAARWLAARRFYRDTRAFRHLPVLLAELGRHDELVALVGSNFLPLAIAGLQPPTAIVNVLSTTASSAARCRDWPTLVRCLELRQSVDTYGSERLPTCLVDYADVVIELFGAKTVSDSLLYDGAATVPARWGLQLCAAVDAGGGAAPWTTYFQLREDTHDMDTTAYGNHRDDGVFLAELRGNLRLSSPYREQDTDNAPEEQFDHPPRKPFEQRLADFLDQEDLPALPKVLDVVLDVVGPSLILASTPHLNDPRRRGEVLLYMAERIDGGQVAWADLPSARKLAVAAWESAGSWLNAEALLRVGVPVQDLADEILGDDRLRTLRDVTDEVLRDSAPDAAAVRRWLSAIAIAESLDPTAVAGLLGQLAGVGFYRAWLRFAVSTVGLGRQLATGEVRAAQASSAVRVALDELAQHAHQFTGKPRACDLYSIHEQIQYVLRGTVALLTADDLPAALTALQAISDGTTYTLAGSAGYGPLTTLDLLALLSLTVGAADADLVQSLVQHHRDESAEHGHYSELANFELEMARLSLNAGDSTEAGHCWTRAAHYLAGYSDHKEITIYELLDSLPDLAAVDPDKAKIRLSRLQPLTELVVQHTDGKETSAAPHYWWERLADIDPALCAQHAAHVLLTKPDLPSERIAAAHHQLLAAQADIADPIALAALRLAAGAGGRHLERDIALFDRLAALSDTDAAVRAVLPVLADAITAVYDDQPIMHTDPDHVGPHPTNRLREAAQRLGADGAPLQAERPEPDNPSRSPRTQASGWVTKLDAHHRPILPSGGVGAIHAIRDHSSKSYSADSDASRWEADALVNAIGWRVLQVTHDSGQAAAARLLHRIADESRPLDDKAVLADLAAGLALRDEPTLAAIAYTLAYTRTRGGGGWLAFAGGKHVHLWQKARDLDEAAAMGCLAKEVALIVDGWSFGSGGVAQALIAAFADPTTGAPDTDAAFLCWDSAYDVIAGRLPGTPYLYAPTYQPSSTVVSQSDINGWLATLAVSTLVLPDRGDRRRALVAVSVLLAARPTLAQHAVTWIIATGLDAGPLTWLLNVMYTGWHVLPLTHELTDQLTALATSDALSVRVAAARLLAIAGKPVPDPPATHAHPALVATWSSPPLGLVDP